ncbi:MAG: hypothetical protein QGG38_04610 [Nitrospinaceae bacterium]|nr:hypothetical protein [Nitrospinaceae bacterium]MDP6711956.1 hypothetical protein [Nitrospinaceae bacterium]
MGKLQIQGDIIIPIPSSQPSPTRGEVGSFSSGLGGLCGGHYPPLRAGHQSQ